MVCEPFVLRFQCQPNLKSLVTFIIAGAKFPVRIPVVVICLAELKANPSVGEPVRRVSDEGGFGRARPLGRAQPVSRVSGKTDRSRGWHTEAKSDETLVSKGRFEISTSPHVGKGVGIP